MKKCTKHFHRVEIFSAVSIFFVVIAFFLMIFSGGFLSVSKADFYGFPGGIPGPAFDASTYSNIRGWAWSGFLGWISFSCNNTGVCGSSNYGVYMVTQADITGGDFPNTYDAGALVGHAWSDSVGWISFDREEATQNGADPVPGADPFVGEPYLARVDLAGTRALTGWARAMSSTGDNWNGWIKLDGAGYGVSVGIGGDFVGYAWGGEAVGWISFNNATGGGAFVYRVFIPSGGVPSASNLSADFISECSDNKNPRFNFTYDSGLGGNMTDLEIEIIKTGGDFGAPFKTLSSSGRTDPPGTNVSILYVADDLDRNQSYEWRLRVTDEFGFQSLWVEDVTDPDFFVEVNRRPSVIFDWTPVAIVPNIDVAFTSTAVSVCYTGEVARNCAVGSGDILTWSIPDATYIVGGSASEDPTVQFNSSGVKNVVLTIQGNGFGALEQCSRTAADILGVGGAFDVSKPIPDFQEQRP